MGTGFSLSCADCDVSKVEERGGKEVVRCTLPVKVGNGWVGWLGRGLPDGLFIGHWGVGQLE